ncbi:hypothetical protein N7532_011944 [Penicillium argentinense]|uniref:Methyltransferase domain-containing protein n=1 Tax=Penicillium argentinense TaxID=1131581 RepID=A0A9W9EJM6_9EURO|nr:uncharacterized protein N7532_011944 [Penicillium argentinense]KAJ5082901.1 hypothetical protein N7532_011944 [Penicillium argentinense]
MTEFTEANRKYFDDMAKVYKDRFADAMKTLCDETLKHRLWLSDRWTDTEAGKDGAVKMLEYACGPGIISMTLAPFLSKVIGIDVADNMVDEFNLNAKNIGVSDKMVGYKADLLGDSASAEFSGSEFTNFDMVTVSMALHHFEYPQVALQRLADRLKKGGTCMIIDLVPSGHVHGHENGHDHGHGHDHEFGPAAHTVKTHGFSREDMQKLFEGAGLSEGFGYEVLPEPLVMVMDDKTHRKVVFIARARLP